MPASVFDKAVLPNGVRVLTASMPQAKSVACFVMLAAGSRYETRETNGIAHFAEHMFFKGTEKRPDARVIAGEIDSIGGEFNAFTGKEYTGYYVKCAAEHRDVALDVLVDMLRNSKFDPEEIEREKGVIVEEMNMYYDTPRDYVEGVYDELLYGDQPLGWEIIGGKETVRAAGRETFLDYLGRWYRAPRMVAGVAGNVGRDVVSRLEELLGSVEDGSEGAPDGVSWKQDGPRVKIHTKQSDQAHVRVGVHSYPLEHPDRYALALLATVLGGGMSSRLFTEVRERRGLAYSVGSSVSRYADTGTMSISAGVSPENLNEATTVIMAELRRLVDEPVGEEELTKARDYAAGSFRLGLESTMSLGQRAGDALLTTGVIEPVDEVVGKLRAVTAADVQRVARRLFHDNNLAMAVVGPAGDADELAKLLRV